MYVYHSLMQSVVVSFYQEVFIWISHCCAAHVALIGEIDKWYPWRCWSRRISQRTGGRAPLSNSVHHFSFLFLNEKLWYCDPAAVVKQMFCLKCGWTLFHLLRKYMTSLWSADEFPNVISPFVCIFTDLVSSYVNLNLCDSYMFSVNYWFCNKGSHFRL